MATIISATVEQAQPTHLVVTFDEPIIGAVYGDFSISGKTISSKSISSTGLILTLIVSSPFLPGDSIALNYIKPASNPLRSVRLYNEMEGASDYMQMLDDTAGQESLLCINTTPYKNTDIDYLWFDENKVQRTVLKSELVGYDFWNTFVKYDNVSPYALSAFMIKKSASSIAQSLMNRIRNNFNLSVWWDNTLSGYGYVKGNRGIGRSIWTTPINLTLTLITGGVKLDWTDTSGGVAETEIWAKDDNGSYSLITTIAAGIVTYSNIQLTAVDLRYYKLRHKFGVVYSRFTAESSIALLGPEKIDQTLWCQPGLAYWNISANGFAEGDGSKIIFDGGMAYLSKGLFWEANKIYRSKTTWVVTSGSIHNMYTLGFNSTITQSGTVTEFIIAYNTTIEAYGDVPMNFVGQLTALSIKEKLI